MTAWARRVLGRLAVGSRALIEAEALLAQSLATFEAIESQFESGKGHLDLAELAHVRGNPMRPATMSSAPGPCSSGATRLVTSREPTPEYVPASDAHQAHASEVLAPLNHAGAGGCRTEAFLGSMKPLPVARHARRPGGVVAIAKAGSIDSTVTRLGPGWVSSPSARGVTVFPPRGTQTSPFASSRIRVGPRR